MATDERKLLSYLQQKSPRTTSELIAGLSLSRPTLSRYVNKLGNRIARVGRTKSTHYLATRVVSDLGDHTPLFEVLEDGSIVPLGIMHFRFADGAVIEFANGQITAHPGVPWFLDDGRPQGFLGRAFLLAHPELRLPPLQSFRSDDTLRALALRGEDLPGNILVSDDSVQRFQALTHSHRQAGRVLTDAEREKRYPTLAEQALRGETPGSSAGGEQPKFTATVSSNSAHSAQRKHRAVIVKFSPNRKDPAGARWADLLICEHLALQTLAEHGLSVSESQLIEADDRVFLESTRFDRVPTERLASGLGRRPLVSMTVVDAEFIGVSTITWSAVAYELVRQKRLSEEDAFSVYKLDAFGSLIANSDRHLSNLSLFWQRGARDKFTLAPTYDMLPMLFRPLDAWRPSPVLMPPTYDAHTLAVWDEMRELARAYWAKVMTSKLVSAKFKRECAKPFAAFVSA